MRLGVLATRANGPEIDTDPKGSVLWRYLNIRFRLGVEKIGALLTTLKELSDADPHAAHSAIHYSLQSRVNYLIETHLPDHTRDLAEAVGAVLRKCYLVCFGTDLLASEGQSGSLYQDNPSFVRDHFGLKIRSGGGGYRRTTRRALFLNNLSNAAPQLPSSTPTPGLWQSLASILGDISFKDGNEEQRWTAFYASGLLRHSSRTAL